MLPVKFKYVWFVYVLIKKQLAFTKAELAVLFSVVVPPVSVWYIPGFNPGSGQTKDCNIGICCFATKYAALMIKSKD